MDFHSFMRVIDGNVKYSNFIDDLKKQLSKQKLLGIISQGNIALATNSDLKIYYNNNKKQFLKVSSVKGHLYSSKNQKALLAKASNLLSHIQGVNKKIC